MFSVKILDNNKELSTNNQYVSLKHLTEYSIKLINNYETRCDAVVSIDGKEVGTWRINSYSNIVIDRPADTKRKFTFVAENSDEAKLGNLTVGESHNGVISVTFNPEKKYRKYEDHQICNESTRSSRCFSGGTILGGNSNQTFGQTTMITDVETSAITTIVIRLIVDNSLSQKYIPLNSVKEKYIGYSESIPQRLN